MCVTREGCRPRGHEVDVTASSRGSVVPLLVDGPSEFRKKPVPGHASAVQVCGSSLNVTHANCQSLPFHEPRGSFPREGTLNGKGRERGSVTFSVGSMRSKGGAFGFIGLHVLVTFGVFVIISLVVMVIIVVAIRLT